MAQSGNKLIADAKLLIALLEDSAKNIKRSKVVNCIENGADVNIMFPNHANNTPLHIAVTKGDREIVNVLLKYGAKANIANDEGKTAIEIASALSERSDIVELLSPREVPAEETAGAGGACPAAYMFRKRAGTAGVRGQLYETKLLTLVYLRVWRCDNITQFLLATNVDGIGDMDDVCLRFKTTFDDYAVFLQAKHKHDVVKGRLVKEDLWSKTGDFSLLKYFSSYRKIRDKFNHDAVDELFRGRYEDTKCYYIMYTTVKDDIECARKKPAANDEVVSLITTGEHQNIFQLNYDEQYVNLLTKAILVERIKDMGRKLFKLIQNNKHDVMLVDEDIRHFHVILAQKVIKVSDVDAEGRRSAIFREEFFSSNEDLLIVLKETLYKEATRNNNLSNDEISLSVMQISLEPNKDTISKLIGSILTYDSHTNALKLNNNRDEEISRLQWLLKPLQVPQSVINDALDIAGRKALSSLTFKVPAAFGNVDMTVSKKKAARRLEYLANKISDVINETANEDGIVFIREGVFAEGKWLTAGDLGTKGGIAGAVGNLLVHDDENRLKFNLDIDLLQENSKMLLLKLKERIIDLERYRFVMEAEDFPVLSFFSTEQEKRLASDFLDKLYFYTCQAKEEQLEDIGARELQAHEYSDSFSRAESRMRSNAMFLKIHNEIQIWWMSEQITPYLTRTTFDHIYSDLVNKGLLMFLNWIYLNEMHKVGLEFNSDAVKALSVCLHGARDSKVVVIHTDVPPLTCHKLVQYFKGDEDYLFLDIDYLCRMAPNCLTIITDELTKSKISNIVIISDEACEYKAVFDACGINRIILVTKHHVPIKGYHFTRDDKINLTDLTDKTQHRILQTKFSFQGIEVRLAAVFDDEMKHLLDRNILIKIINKEQFTLGQTLALSSYEQIKYYYVPRTLQCNKRHDYYTDFSQSDSHGSSDTSSEDGWVRGGIHFSTSNKPPKTASKTASPKTLIDHDFIPKRKKKKYNPYCIILIIDAPGMGKSTLLTHLSLETKRHYPKIWIQRINLIDHTKQFYEWHEKNVHMDSVEALKFVCKIMMSKRHTNRHVGVPDNNENEVCLECANGEFKLIDRQKYSVLEALELELFLHCFNTGRIVFLFDGFDEVCPLYKREVTELLKYLARRGTADGGPAAEGEKGHSKQCVWITSRPYNDLRETLEKEFGDSYTLQPFSYADICIFFDKYMRRNLNLNGLNSDQLRNIDGFFQYMKQYDLDHYEIPKEVALVNIPLHCVYVAAVEYFQSEIKRMNVADNCLMFVKEDMDVNTLVAWRRHLTNKRLNDVVTLSGVPLHVHIAVQYFKCQVEDTTLTPAEDLVNQWDLDTNAFAFYERFIETKLKTIRFEEKNRMDVYNPDVKLTYEKEKKVFLDTHKKLAFYSVGSKTVFTDYELLDVEEIITRMETGEEKTGLIDRIVDGEPKFVHYTFAEYFAVEYITDCLKSSETNTQVRMLDYILSNMALWATMGILNLFDLKIKFDSELMSAISTPQVSNFIFETLIEQSTVEYPPDVYDDYIGDREDLTATALDKVVRCRMKYFATILIDAITCAVDETRFADFMKLIKEGTFFKRLIVWDQDELVSKILDCIRRFDASEIDALFPYSLFETRIHSRSSNEEFLEAYHQKILEKFYASLLPSLNRRHMSMSD